jgi:hypothetical protein
MQEFWIRERILFDFQKVLDRIPDPTLFFSSIVS